MKKAYPNKLAFLKFTEIFATNNKHSTKPHYPTYASSTFFDGTKRKTVTSISIQMSAFYFYFLST